MSIEKLFVLIEKQASIESFQTELANFNNIEEVKSEILAATNKRGDNLLHAAVRQSLFPIVGQLMSLGFSPQSKNSQCQTATDLARDNQRMDSLLKTHGDWVGLAKGLDIHRIIRMLSGVKSRILNAYGEDKVLFIGPTGSGKSTFMNARFGVRYEIKLRRGAKPIAEPLNDSKAVVEVGSGVASTTLYPTIKKREGNNFSHVDLAGLFENRGREYQVVAASMAQCVANTSGNIKGLLVFIDLPSLQASRSEGLRQVADALYRMCEGKEELLSSVRYVVTKALPENIRQGLSRESIDENYLNDLLNDAEEKNHDSVKFMLYDMVDNLDKIFIDDLSPQSGNKIDSEFNNMQSISAAKFNFMVHDEAQRDLQSFLVELPKQYLEMKEKISTIPGAIKNALQEVQNLEQKINALNSEISQDEKDLAKLSQSITENPAIKTILDEIASRGMSGVLQQRLDELFAQDTEKESQRRVTYRELAKKIVAKKQTVIDAESSKKLKSQSIEQLQSEKETLALELSVNQPFFTSVAKLIQELNIQEEHVEAFLESVNSSAQPAKFAEARAFFGRPLQMQKSFFSAMPKFMHKATDEPSAPTAAPNP